MSTSRDWLLIFDNEFWREQALRACQLDDHLPAVKRGLTPTALLATTDDETTEDKIEWIFRKYGKPCVHPIKWESEKTFTIIYQ